MSNTKRINYIKFTFYRVPCNTGSMKNIIMWMLFWSLNFLSIHWVEYTITNEEIHDTDRRLLVDSKVLVYPSFSLLSVHKIPYIDSNIAERTIDSTHDKKKDLIRNQRAEYPEGEISLEYIMGKFDPSAHPEFIMISSEYTDKSEMYMHREAYKSFMQMWHHAHNDGVHLKITSATRNFNRQKQIWEGKWTGKIMLEGHIDATKIYPQSLERAKAILRYSSMPGTSRHHWGTDIDLNSFDNTWFEHGDGKKLYDWMLDHAYQYGFCQPYTELNDMRPYGYQEEKWHWTYVPISSMMTEYARKYLRNIDIIGFEGCETAKEIAIVNHYVLGTHPNCF